MLLNVKVGTTKVQLAMDVVEGTVPLLISLEALKQMEAIIDLKKSETTHFGKRTKRVKMTRHLVILFKIDQTEKNPKTEIERVMVSQNEKSDLI